MYWIEMPPVHISLAGITRALGGKPPKGEKAKKKRVGTDAEAAQFAAEMKAMAAQLRRGGQ